MMNNPLDDKDWDNIPDKEETMCPDSLEGQHCNYWYKHCNCWYNGLPCCYCHSEYGDDE